MGFIVRIARYYFARFCNSHNILNFQIVIIHFFQGMGSKVEAFLLHMTNLNDYIQGKKSGEVCFYIMRFRLPIALPATHKTPNKQSRKPARCKSAEHRYGLQ